MAEESAVETAKGWLERALTSRVAVSESTTLPFVAIFCFRPFRRESAMSRWLDPLRGAL